MKKLLFLFLLCFQFVSAQELALIMEKKNVGYINKSGEVVIEPQFRKADSFSEGLAAVEKDKQWGYINTSGNWVVEP